MAGDKPLRVVRWSSIITGSRVAHFGGTLKPSETLQHAVLAHRFRF